jgi:hypothetical protein
LHGIGILGQSLKLSETRENWKIGRLENYKIGRLNLTGERLEAKNTCIF